MNSNGLEYNIAGQTTPAQTSVVVDAPLTKWYCDECGGLIEGAANGYVIWQVMDYNPCNVKIVHHIRCNRSSSYCGSCALDEYVGHDGLSHILEWLSAGPIAKIGYGDYCSVTDYDEYVDFVRRVQIPYYEQARRYFLKADVVEYHARSNKVATYQPDELKKMILKFGSSPD